VLLEAIDDESVARVLGCDRAGAFAVGEPEHPELLVAVLAAGDAANVPNALPDDAIDAIALGEWRGLPNRLSAEHVEYPIIEATRAHCLKPRTAESRRELPAIHINAEESPQASPRAQRIFLQRRSAVDFDGVTSISREAFFGMLERTMPRTNRPPFDVWPYEPLIHFGIFIHRVDGLAPGVYFLARNSDHQDALHAATRREFVWATPLGCPTELPLFLLAEADCRGLAAQISCTQAIAGDSAFSLGMIARFEPALRQHGAWFYPRLYWEAGLIGQTLYLEAEAAGVRGTGIGCYFDDPVHRVFGLSGHEFQSLYHFTIGGPVDDPRLTSLPAYSAERRAQRGWV
jgi:hypothetical protein